ncbi:MAG: bifunctional hydroxymethylpyrimidine kinase/phosphomethylpyrimidine kinase [Leptothrix ochracea]
MSPWMNTVRPVVWSVAGNDSGAGAGLQADLRAFDACGVHGCTVVATLTAQNSCAVQRVEAVSASMLDAQLAALAEDLRPRVIKTGLLGSAEAVQVLAGWVRRLRAQVPDQPVALVIDPVWRASTGASMAGEGLRQALLSELLPLATVITPNRAEAAWLLGRSSPLPEMAQDLAALGPSGVVITGGDGTGLGADAELACDWLHSAEASGWLFAPRLLAPHNHGTGCVFASTLASALAHGFAVADAVVLAKMMVTDALRHGYAAGSGAGPVSPHIGFAARPENLPGFRPDELRHALPMLAPPEAFAPERGLDLYAVVDSAAWVERLARAGVRTVQLRLKPDVALARGVDLRVEIARCVALQKRFDLKFYVNDHWALAIEAGAYGVHVGQEDLDQVDVAAIRHAGLRLGLSTHSLWELARAWALRPSYIACGPVHATTTKDMPWQPQGVHNLGWWRQMLPTLPVVGIGGFTPERLEAAARTGVDGLAVLSGITAASDPEAAVQAYQDALRRGRSEAALVAPRWPRPSLRGRWGGENTTA